MTLSLVGAVNSCFFIEKKKKGLIRSQVVQKKHWLYHRDIVMYMLAIMLPNW